MEIEKQWKTKAGLNAVVVMMDRGYRCGYVGVPIESSIFGFDYDNKIVAGVDVHGGLTYSGLPDWSNDDNVWYFGYDCDHIYDLPINGDQMRSNCFGDEAEHRTLEYCVDKCEKLAEQLSVIGGHDE